MLKIISSEEMPKEEPLQKELEIMKNHLKELRKIAGWSTEELGQKLGMTRQAVNALERGDITMNRIHFLSLIYLFTKECEINRDNTVLANVLFLLFNNTDQYKEKQEEYDISIADIVAMGTTVSLFTKNLVLAGLGLYVKDKNTSLPKLSKKILNLGKKTNINLTNTSFKDKAAFIQQENMPKQFHNN